MFGVQAQEIKVAKTSALNTSLDVTSLWSSSSSLFVALLFLLLLLLLDVNKSKATSGATALHVASQNGHVEIIKLLVGAEGIKVNKLSIEGFTPLHVASQNNHIEIVKLLLGGSGKDEDKISNKLHIFLFLYINVYKYVTITRWGKVSRRYQSKLTVSKDENMFSKGKMLFGLGKYYFANTR